MSGSTSIGDGNYSIIPSSGSNRPDAFTTSGQIDWIKLLKTPFGSSIGILSRMSAAQVDPYTVIVGQKLGNLFHLTSNGRNRILDELSKLRSFKSLGKALWFGLGVNHLVRILAKTEEGKMCIALCASMSEFYEISIAAEILIEMAKTSRAPEDLRPSILEWKALLDTCAGVFAASTFPVLAEKYMQLHPQHRALGYESLQTTATKVRGCSSPESLAKALLALGELSRGDLASFTIIGGADAGWLGAFAEFFFELSLRIVLGPTGEVLYSSLAPDQDVQVLIVYDNDGIVDVSGILTTGKTHRLSDATLLIERQFNGSVTRACVAGRLDWNTILDSVFGPEFKKLSQNPQALGGALGSLARILKAVATAEGDVQPHIRKDRLHYNDASYGKGFIMNVVCYFPELAPLRDRMEQAVRQDLPNAFAKYEAYTTALRLACNCRFCQGELVPHEGYCCVLILEVIASMAQILSVVTLPITISPSRLGLEALYSHQLLLRRKIDENPHRKQELREFGPAFFAIQSCSLPIIDAMQNFCGRLPEDVSVYDQSCAVSVNGVCAYYGALSDLSDDSESLTQVIVVPGRIELHGKDYRLMNDLTNNHTQEVHGWPSVLPFNEFSVLVKETTSGLQIAFEVCGSDRRVNQKTLIYPAHTIDGLARRRGLISCPGASCGSVADDVKVKDERQGYRLYELAGVKVEAFEINLLQRWMLMNLKSNLGYEVFFVDKECINCCLRAAVGALQDNNSRQVVIIRAEQKII